MAVFRLFKAGKQRHYCAIKLPAKAAHETTTGTRFRVYYNGDHLRCHTAISKLFFGIVLVAFQRIRQYWT
jgi:hypothetical protein